MRILYLSLLLTWAGVTKAQQLPLFTQYRQHASVLNPAMVNADYLLYEHNVSIGISHRSQWTDFDNHPVTQTLIGDYIYTEGGSISLMAGGFIINDQTGPTGLTSGYGKIGGILSDDPYFGGLGMALSAGIVQYRVRTEEIRLHDNIDRVPLNNQSKTYSDAGLGVFYYQRISNNSWLDKTLVYGGISIPQIIGLNAQFSDLTGEISTKRLQHFYANAGIYKFLDNDRFIEPSVWLRYVPNAPLSLDVNVRYQMSASFWIGAGGALSGNAHLEAGCIIGERLRIGYGFDYAFNTYGNLAGNTHEVHVNYSFLY